MTRVQFAVRLGLVDCVASCRVSTDHEVEIERVALMPDGHALGSEDLTRRDLDRIQANAIACYHVALEVQS